MPEICRFSGIRITMYFGPREHPPPHFHASHGQDEASVCIRTGMILEGRLPSSCMQMIRAWVAQNRAALEENWKLAQDERALKRIPPP
jgi:hypothetical protein